MIYQFIADHRAEFGVVPICRALRRYDVQLAPRSFYAWVSRGPSRRGLWETVIAELLAGYYEPDAEGRRPAESLYGSLKMWAHLQRQGVQVARCTIERLMRRHGWRGVTRRRRPRTTVSDPTAERARIWCTDGFTPIGRTHYGWPISLMCRSCRGLSTPPSSSMPLPG